MGHERKSPVLMVPGGGDRGNCSGVLAFMISLVFRSVGSRSYIGGVVFVDSEKWVSPGYVSLVRRSLTQTPMFFHSSLGTLLVRWAEIVNNPFLRPPISR